MDCHKVESKLRAVLDGEIQPSELPRLWEHLSKCPRCSAELAALKSVEGLVSRLPTIPSPADLSSRVLAELGLATLPYRLRSLLGVASAVAAIWVATLGVLLSFGLVVLSPISGSWAGLRSVLGHLFTSFEKVLAPIQVVLAALGRALTLWAGPYMLLGLLFTLGVIVLLVRLLPDLRVRMGYSMVLNRSCGLDR